ncbi:MAG: HyaD/HybD family hydrogenase maturation endopeptidase [Desulfobacterales bacterium]
MLRLRVKKNFTPLKIIMSLTDPNPFDEIYATDIMVLGIGCTLFCDEGFGVQIVAKMEQQFEFPDNVILVDGGVLGINLLGVISKPKHLIVVDAIRNKGKPGDLYRLAGDAIPERIRAKNSLHQVDFLEALTLCQALDHVPETVIIGVEPEDIETMCTELTPTILAKVDDVIEMVLAELDRLGVAYYTKGTSGNVSGNPV